MSMLKVIEVLAESEKSWEDAAQVAVANASKTVRNIRSIYIKNAGDDITDGRVVVGGNGPHLGDLFLFLDRLGHLF